MEEKDEIIISPKVIGSVLKKNIIFIIITVFVFSLCSFLVTNLFITKQYTASASLYVEIKNDENSDYNPVYSLNMYNYAQKLVATYTKLLNQNAFYTDLSEKLNNRYTPSQLKRMISFRSDDETEIFDVYVVTDSPTESKRIADAVAEAAPERISSLNSNAELKVCDYAQVPSGPSSPNTTKNVMIAFVLGLAVSVAVAFIRHFADKKIKYNDEMTEIYDIPVLAAIPNFDSYINQKKS